MADASKISALLLSTIRRWMQDALERNEKMNGQGAHVLCRDGIACCIMSVASLESFLNETFLDPMIPASFPESDLAKAILDSRRYKKLDRSPIMNKLTHLPSMLLPQSPHKDEFVVQEAQRLVEIRNALVHYKLLHSVPKSVDELNSKEVLLCSRPDFSWPSKLGCFAFAHWCHNTVCKAVQKVDKCDAGKLLNVNEFGNFDPLSDEPTVAELDQRRTVKQEIRIDPSRVQVWREGTTVGTSD